jgi:T5SS/PEP-CTERM-associated repeat protein
MGSTLNWGGVLYVGYSGTGTVEITNGGSASGASDLVIGEVSGSLGTVTVGGASSHVNTDNMFVGGNGGEGALQITDGALVESLAGTQVAVGFDGVGTVTIDGINSRWYVPGVLYVGKLAEGNGTLHVTNGGWLDSGTTGFGILGVDQTSTGSVIIQGTGSKWTNFAGYVRVGDGGAGSLTVEDGGTVETPNLYIGLYGELRGDGNVIANVESVGLVSPGTSTGALHIDGDYTELSPSNAELLIELASDGYDQLLIDGDAILRGMLTVNLLDGFIPSIGQSFTILTADDIIFTFSAEMIPSVPNLAFDVIYNAQSVVLTVLSALPGDYNGDGTVDAADYIVWRKNDGTQQGYDTWHANFGETVGSGAEATDGTSRAAAPELSTDLFAVLGLAYLSGVRRRKP